MIICVNYNGLIVDIRNLLIYGVSLSKKQHRTTLKLATMRARQTIIVDGQERLVCPLCSKFISKSKRKRAWSVDHIIPRSRGGRSNIENLQLVHKKCNEAKANNLVGIDEADLQLILNPAAVHQQEPQWSGYPYPLFSKLVNYIKFFSRYLKRRQINELPISDRDSLA